MIIFWRFFLNYKTLALRKTTMYNCSAHFMHFKFENDKWSFHSNKKNCIAVDHVQSLRHPNNIKRKVHVASTVQWTKHCKGHKKIYISKCTHIQQIWWLWKEQSSLTSTSLNIKKTNHLGNQVLALDRLIKVAGLNQLIVFQPFHSR